MSRLSASLLVVAAVAATAACAPNVGRHGFQPVDVTPSQIQAGTDTRETVLAQLGSPSAVSTFEDDIWYYISQTTEKYTYNRAEVSAREVTMIRFADGGDQVIEVRTLGLEDGQDVGMNPRETPTRGREMTVLEQLLGNVGRTRLPNSDENVPGQRRPD